MSESGDLVLSSFKVVSEAFFFNIYRKTYHEQCFDRRLFYFHLFKLENFRPEIFVISAFIVLIIYQWTVV